MLPKPKAIRDASLISQLVPSVAALVVPVLVNASIWGHQASMVCARMLTSGTFTRAHQS
jgi:hypothetical protein